MLDIFAIKLISDLKNYNNINIFLLLWVYYEDLGKH